MKTPRPYPYRPPVYETYSTIDIEGCDVEVRVRYLIAEDAVFLLQARVEGDNADWILDIFTDALTDACEADYARLVETWAEDAKARRDARQEAAK